MIDATIEYEKDNIPPLSLTEVLNQIGRYKQTYLQQEVADRFSANQTGFLASRFAYRVKEEEGLVEIFNDAPYARIQLTPGEKFIKASPVTVTHRFNPAGTTPAEQRGVAIRPFQTYQMARYFWALFFNTGEEKYKAFALKVHRQGGVIVEGKDVMQWKEEDIDYIVQLVEDKIIEFFDTQGKQTKITM